ncbi:MAG: glycosyltransferase 87 family protein [Candidatus Nanopelagicales bacterium]
MTLGWRWPRWLVLCIAVLVSVGTQLVLSARALSMPGPVAPSVDYKMVVWNPVRGLLAGFNPYDPMASEYFSQFGNGTTGLHPPSLWLVTSPLIIAPPDVSYLMFVVVSVLAMWGAALLLIPPVNRRALIWAVVTGFGLVLSGPAGEMLLLGQVVPFVVLGLALVLRCRGSWAGAVGIAALMVNPQFGLGFCLLLWPLGFRKDVVRGLALTAVLSIPVAILAIANAGGPVDFMHSIGRELRFLDGSENAINRMDLPGRYATGSLMVSLIGVGLVVLAAWWLFRKRPVISDELALGMAALLLLVAYSMPYNLPVVIAVGFAVLYRATAWGTVEWATAGLIALSALVSLPFLEWMTGALDINIGAAWLAFTLAAGVLLIAIVVFVAARLRSQVAKELQPAQAGETSALA